MAADSDTRARQARAEDSRAARLRRLWRSQDTTLRSSGLALGRPVLAMARPEASDVPTRGLTARELINMARAARREGERRTGLSP
jgi:hypothetical protein